MSTLPQTEITNVRAVDVLGCTVHAVTASQLTDLLERAVESNAQCVIAHHNLHSLYLYQRDTTMREFYAKASWTHADGMSMVVLGRVAGIDIERSVRVTYIDWLPMIMERATARKWRVFYLGSRPGVAQRGVAILREKNVGLEMVSRHGFFDPNGAGNDQVLSEIRAFSPDILLVGMGMPRQEHWILDNLDRLGPMAVLPCGASIDYVAGEIPTPPRWTGRIGVEWLYRLVVEPSRLWKRYLLEPWSIVFLMGQHWLNKA